ncbi:hypothetical protein HMPREF2660_03350 [Weeksella sp. HMSC059D05]|nr:hypothetical protein HMPREF2660_03350 [Weeksella sp. HMSC059D05]
MIKYLIFKFLKKEKLLNFIRPVNMLINCYPEKLSLTINKLLVDKYIDYKYISFFINKLSILLK